MLLTSPKYKINYFKLFIFKITIVFYAFNLWALSTPQEEINTNTVVHVIKVEAIINPVSAEFITSSIKKAVEAGAHCLIIELDTPGGLMESMRQITKEFLASRIPIIVYVSPPGSRAASAGV
ncbi:MAG: hypothetical protein ACE5HX_15335, partial [bacterium]